MTARCIKSPRCTHRDPREDSVRQYTAGHGGAAALQRTGHGKGHGQGPRSFALSPTDDSGRAHLPVGNDWLWREDRKDRGNRLTRALPAPCESRHRHGGRSLRVDEREPLHEHSAHPGRAWSMHSCMHPCSDPRGSGGPRGPGVREVRGKVRVRNVLFQVNRERVDGIAPVRTAGGRQDEAQRHEEPRPAGPPAVPLSVDSYAHVRRLCYLAPRPAQFFGRRSPSLHPTSHPPRQSTPWTSRPPSRWNPASP